MARIIIDDLVDDPIRQQQIRDKWKIRQEINAGLAFAWLKQSMNARGFIRFAKIPEGK